VHLGIFLGCILSVAEADIRDLITPIFLLAIFILVLLLDLLVVSLIEVVMQDLTQNFLLLTLILAHEEDFLVDFSFLSI
jgi:hypothetical protein